MFDPQTTAFLETGCALIVGTVSPSGEPHAGRAWGLTVVEDGPTPQVRLLLDAEDLVTIDHVADGGAIAVTAASVRTLSSIQLKGHARASEDATPADEARAARYIEAFFGDIMDTDGTSPSLLQRFVPTGYLACTVEVLERFDQTPGPGAGARVGGAP